MSGRRHPPRSRLLRMHSRQGRVQLLDALEVTHRAGGTYEEALLLDSLATLYSDKDAAEQRDTIIEQLGIVKLPPFLTP